MAFSNNAQPVPMFRVDRVSPFKLPSILGYLGPMRIELFLGQLSGHHFIFEQGTGVVGSWTSPLSPQPMLSGERFSFKPTPNVEFGFSLTTIFAGPGAPLTVHSYLKSIFSTGNTTPGASGKPGDRRSAFDLTYRLPLLRNWATFYADGFTEDQFSPVAYWDRAGWIGGLYISHFPKIPKLDLRMEGVYTDLPIGGAVGPGYWYWNATYRNGFTNDGNFMGSWIGRGGQGAQVWSNYWLTPKNKIQLNFRHQKVSAQFIGGGGSITDLGGQTDYSVRKDLDLSLSMQYERWLFPAIQPGVTRNFTTSLTLRFTPNKSVYPKESLESSIGSMSFGQESTGGRP